ncbi:unnamed protein product [Angiostrongylus costaricensis]|uniref:C2H2-type domain-containing protein n=1 Tax=Angiostrongylus costaricensis TaxID=334426 RepID=A0A158PG57_ANGCS|nr:unnamed protein product [Angiostrongylus costaricensis]
MYGPERTSALRTYRNNAHGRQRINTLSNHKSLMGSSSLISCPECVKSVEVKYIGEHLEFVHKYTIEERRIILGFLAKDRATLASVYPFKCDVCLESFQTKRKLSSHQIGVHSPIEPSTENEFECAFAECEQSFATSEDFVSHCAISHSAGSHHRFEIINESFQDMQELLDWKADIEERTCTSFRIRRSNDRHTTEFECHRAGSIIPSKPSTDVISPKTHCTAFMKCWIRKDGTVEVIACTEHLGHEKDPRKLLLSEKQKDELQGLSAPEIFKKVRKRYGVMSRMHFVTDADLALLFDSKYIHERVFGTQKKNYTCPECDEGPMPIQQLRKHIGEIHGRVAKIANAAITANGSGKNGRKWDNIYYSCKECQFLCFTESVLDTHVKVIENEEGVLDCIGFFGHLGHQSDCGVSADVVKKEIEAETDKDETTIKVKGDEIQPCCLCGNVTVPELDGMMIIENNWSCCNVGECKAVAHNLCIQLLGGTCLQCERGVLIEANAPTGGGLEIASLSSSPASTAYQSVLLCTTAFCWLWNPSAT